MIFATLRILGLLRRSVRALESLAESQKELATAAQNRRLSRESAAARRPRKTQFDVLDLRESEKLYAKQRDAEAYGEEPPTSAA